MDHGTQSQPCVQHNVSLLDLKWSGAGIASSLRLLLLGLGLHLLEDPLHLWHEVDDAETRVLHVTLPDENVGTEYGVGAFAAHGIPAIEEAELYALVPLHAKTFSGPRTDGGWAETRRVVWGGGAKEKREESGGEEERKEEWCGEERMKGQ